MKHHTMTAAALAAGTATAFGGVAQTTVVDFESGTEGWSISGRDTIDATGGNGGANLHGELIDVFGADIRNNTNAAFLGDYSRFGGPVTVSIDIKVNSINSLFLPGELPRELVVEFRDYDNDNGFPWTSAWLSLGVLNADVNNEWTTYSVMIDDPTAMNLPMGWGGYGDEDPMTFEPILPSDRTFASVMSSVDEVAFTTFVPGFFFGFTNFDIQVDNVTITGVPAPSGAVLLALAGVAGTRRRR